MIKKVEHKIQEMKNKIKNLITLLNQFQKVFLMKILNMIMIDTIGILIE